MIMLPKRLTSGYTKKLLGATPTTFWPTVMEKLPPVCKTICDPTVPTGGIIMQKHQSEFSAVCCAPFVLQVVLFVWYFEMQSLYYVCFIDLLIIVWFMGNFTWLAVRSSLMRQQCYIIHTLNFQTWHRDVIDVTVNQPRRTWSDASCLTLIGR